MKKAYPKYRQINLPWLKAIPDHWKMVPNKRLFYLSKELVGESSGSYTLLSLTLNGVIKRDMENPKGKFPAEFDTYQVVEPKDLIFCLFDVEETPRAVGLSPFNGMITGAYTVAKCLVNTGEEYLFYYYLFLDNKKSLKYFYTGLRNVIAKDTFGAIKTPLPPLPEQRQIAAFLDHKCALIDTFIQKKTRLIELLKEQKQAIINKAVTKGIDPNVRLKPSGIDWLGDIPEHWEVKKLKYDISVRGRVGWKALKASEYVSEGNIFLSTPNIKNYDIDFDNVDYINDFRFKESPELILEVGDILLTKDGSTTGTVNIVRHLPKPSTVNSSIAVLRPNSTFFSPFLFYFFQSDYIDKIVQNKMLGMGVPHLYQAQIKNFVLIKPPLEEQQSIVDYLEVERARLNNIKDKVIKEIGLLQEYKTTLIAETVTGKIDVRDWKPKQVAEEVEQPINQVQAYGSN